MNKEREDCLLCHNPRSEIDFLYEENGCRTYRGGLYYNDDDQEKKFFVHHGCQVKLLVWISELQDKGLL